MLSKQLYLSHVVVFISARGGAVIHCSTYCIGNHNRKGARGNKCCFTFLQQMKHTPTYGLGVKLFPVFILHVHNGLEMVTQQEYIREKPTVHSMRVLE